MSHENKPEEPISFQSAYHAAQNRESVMLSTFRTELNRFTSEEEITERCSWDSAGHQAIGNNGPPRKHDDDAKYKLLRHEMPNLLARGWCPHHLVYLSKTYDSETFWYLAQLDRSPLRLVDHTCCSDKPTCIAYNADLANYKPRHTTNDCTCPLISTPYGELVKTIRKGRVPLISIEEGEQHADNLPSIQVHGRKRSSKYVAISHVWADGLGNPTHNGLPACQVKLLREYVNGFQKYASTSSKLFWMDTLCIPVRPRHQHLRLLQIDKMASIYKGAYVSLVLDAEIMSMKAPVQATHLEQQARIACSVWMCRSWTLQEGVLSDRIAFQFSSGNVEMDAKIRRPRFIMLRRFLRTFTPVTEKDVAVNINIAAGDDQTADRGSPPHILKDNPELRASCKDDRIAYSINRKLGLTFFLNDHQEVISGSFGVGEFVSTWNMLAGRSTTMAEDTPIIFTNVVNVDNRKLFDCGKPGHMLETIIFSLDRLPLSLFFLKCSRQAELGSKRNGWVPSEIGTDLLTTEHLLHKQGSKLVFKHRKHDPGLSIYAVDTVTPTKTTYAIQTRPYPRQGNHCDDNQLITYAVEPLATGRDNLDLAQFSGTYLIVENSTPWSGAPQEKRGACFLVPIGSENKRKREMVFCCSIRLRRYDGEEASELSDSGPIFDVLNVREKTDFIIKCGMLSLTRLAVATAYRNSDPIPGFSTLRKRRTHHFRYVIPTVCAVIVLVGVVTFGCIKIKEKVRQNPRYSLLGKVVMGTTIGALIVIVLVSVLSVVSGRHFWDRWINIRSFERTSSKRSQARNAGLQS